MVVILLERRPVFHFNWSRPNVHLDAERLQSGHRVAIKVGHGTRYERERAARSLRRLNYELVVEKIEIELKDARPVWDRRRGQSTRRDVQSHFPPLADYRRERQPDFPDSLRPHVECRVGL